MTVTEFAIIHLTSARLSDAVRELLTASIPLQDEWHAAHFPAHRSSAADRAVAWFEQVEDPGWIMTTARWDSVDAHWQWIRSEANAGIMAKLGDGHIVPHDTALFHVAADIFDKAVPASGSVPLLQSPVISVGRMFVASEKKGAFEAKFGEVKDVLEEHAGPDMVRFGWREDLEAGAREEEFVLVCGWESVEKHLGFPQVPGFSRFQPIQGFIEREDTKHYKRFL